MKRIASLILSFFLCLGILPARAQSVDQIKINPVVSCVKLGETVVFTATAYDSTGAPLAGIVFNWILSGPGRVIQKTDSTLTYGAITPGQVTITASADGKSASIQFTVGSPKVQNVQVRVDPEIAGEVATYYVFFETDTCGILSAGDRIYIAFPSGTQFPRSYFCSILTVNGLPATYEQTYDDYNHDTPVLMITIPENLASTTQYYVKICKVINPRGGACYMIAVATDLQQQWALSNSYAIRGSIITPPIVTVTPNIVGEVAGYVIKFKSSSSGRLSSCYGGYIMVEFPYGTKIPATIKSEFVLINGTFCTDSQPVVNGRTVKLFPGMVVLEESDVIIEFKLEAGIQNPETPNDYDLTVWTSSDNVHVDSQTYRITSSKIENVQVIVDKPYINTNSMYTIRFTTGLIGKMNINGLITIYFPTSVTLPKTSRPGDIKVNGVSTSKPAIIEGSYTVVVPLPVEIAVKSSVEIVISESFGIYNPPDPRKYKLEVHTAKEGTNVESQEFLIGPSVIGDLSVNLKNPYIGIPSQIDFSFKTGGGGRLLKDKDQIFIVFPKGTYIPNAIQTKDVLIQGVPLKTTPFLKKDLMEIVLMSPLDISSNQTISVQFLESAGILNPKIPGDYLWQVATTREVSYIKSPLIRITESVVQDVKAIITASAVNELTNMTIDFRLGDAGGLKVGDKINIFFDNDFILPEQYGEAGIRLNQEIIPFETILVNQDRLEISITVTVNILNGSHLQIEILQKAGIKNPSMPGNYTISIATTREPKVIVSNSFIVIPLPETDIVTNPISSDGKNGWFRSDPDVSFVVHTKDRERQKTYFSLNGAEFILYSSPIKLSSGEYTIQFYSAFSNSAKEAVKSITIKVDTKAPMIEIPEKMIYTNQNPYTFIVNVIESNFAYADINGKRIESLLEGKIQIKLDLKDGENPFAIRVVDLAGNETEKSIVLFLDTISPSLVLSEPLPWAKVIRKNIRIIGKTEPECILTLDGQNKGIEKEGTFSFFIDLKPGLNALSFVSTDKAGNEKIYSLPIQYYPNFQAKFKIGKTVSETTFGQMDLGGAVYLEKNVTMVPLRVFTDLLGCKVAFESVFQIITIEDSFGTVIKTQIGNKVFTVNQFKKTLEQPPAIRNSKTFIPIRFFAEEFGFIIKYDKKEQVVILQYNEQ